MSALRIETRDNRKQFAPGDVISGQAVWDVEKPPEGVQVRLFWYTRGKGATDAGVVDKLEVPGPQKWGQVAFSFKAPDSPYSFSGKLISLVWALELVVTPTGESEHLDLTIAPNGREILLTR